MKLPNKSYKFTDKKIPPASVMSSVLAIIAFIALVTMIIISFAVAGEVEMKFGVTSILCLLFSVTSVGLAVRTYFQKNVFHVLSHVGVGFSVVNLFFLMYIYGLGLLQ